MGYKDVVEYFYNINKIIPDYNLDNMKAVLKELGNPEKTLKVIHITGSNGKGSVAAILSSILTQAGYKTGLYTSPHLVDLRERIQINREWIGKEEISDFFNIVSKKLTPFEMITAIALLYFKQKRVDFAVIETGLGGKLDATNVVNSVLSIITNISLEHTDVLGKTIEKIAKDKADIIKKKVPVVVNVKAKALDIIKKICKEKSAELTTAKRLKKIESNLEKQTFSYKNKKIDLKLLGNFQLQNASIAIAAAEKLNIPFNAIKKGLERAEWPGRVSILSKRPLVIADCAHNPDGIKVLSDFLKELKYKKLILVFGVVKEKNYKEMLKELPYDFVVVTEPDIFRKLDAETVSKEIKGDFVIERNIEKAIEYAKNIARKEDLILVTGSCYLVGNLINRKTLG